jgi:hypothetical protein
VTTFLTDAVGKLETFDLANTPDTDSILVGAAFRRSRRRNDLPRVVVPGLFHLGVGNDVLGDSVRSLIRVLLPDVASNSPQVAFLVA